jgi:hypothetical protein
MKKKELCFKLVIYKDYTEMLHGQQNLKFGKLLFLPINPLNSELNSICRLVVLLGD